MSLQSRLVSTLHRTTTLSYLALIDSLSQVGNQRSLNSHPGFSHTTNDQSREFRRGSVNLLTFLGVDCSFIISTIQISSKSFLGNCIHFFFGWEPVKTTNNLLL